MKTRLISSLALALLGSACGAGTATEYANAAPNYQTLALDMEGSDANNQQGAALTPNPCHPHLFQRTREVVANLNLHIYAVVRRLDAAIDAHPDQKSGTSRTWIRTIDGLSVKATLDETGVGSYAYTAGIAKVGGSDYTSFLTGTLTAGAAPHEGSGTITMDLSALGTVDKAVLAQGQFTVTYNVDGTSKVEVVSFTGYQPPDGFNAQDTAIRPPRTGTYTFARTNGVGGSLKFNEQVDLLCPPNPGKAAADVNTVVVWGHDAASGDLVGRADSEATNGQILPGDKWEGVTCFDISKDSDGTGVNAETYWMMKSEAADGTTLTLDLTDSASADPTATPCNAMFGTVPDLSDPTHDYDFAAVNFSDDSVVAYPGEPDGGI
jgi:hypothetical protein